MSRIANAIRSIDILAPDMTLNVNGKSSVKTLPGALLSLGYASLFIYATVLQFIEYFDTTQPLITESTKTEGKYERINLKDRKHIPIVIIMDSTESPVKFEDTKKYATVKYQRFAYSFEADGETTKLEILDYPAVRCQELIDSGNFDPNYYNNLGGYTDLINDSAICFDTVGKDTSIFGAYSDFPSEFMVLNIYPCSLDDLSQCKSKKEVSLSYTQILKLEPEINYGKKENPIGYIVNADDYYPLNPASSGEIQEKLIIKEIVDSAGFMFPKTSVANYTAISTSRYYNRYRDENITTCKGGQNGYNDCVSYYSFWMLTTNRRLTINRSYNGLLSTLGEIGGLKDMCFMAFWLLYKYYHNGASKTELLKRIYGLEQKSRCCKKSARRHKEVNENPAMNFEMKEETVKVTAKSASTAWSNIERSLDVVHLTRELMSLRFLLMTMCNEQTRLLMPTLMCLASEKMDSNEKKDLNINTELRRLKTGKGLTSNNFGNELQSLAGQSSPRRFSEEYPGSPTSPNLMGPGDQIGDLIGALANELFPTDSLMPPTASKTNQIEPGLNLATFLKPTNQESPEQLEDECAKPNPAIEGSIQSKKPGPLFRKMPIKISNPRLDASKKF